MGFFNSVLGRILGAENVAGDSPPPTGPARERTAEADDCMRRGLGRHEAGELQAAETDYRRALGLAPENADAHYLLGSLLGASGRLDEALEHLLQAVRLDPSAAAACADTGNVYRMQGRLAESEAAYRQAIAIDPELASAHRNLGDLLNATGRVDEAIDCLGRAAALAADEAEPQFMLADLLSGRGRYEEACRSYRAGLALAPDIAAAHNNLGASLRHLSRNDEALACFETALRLDPALGDAHLNLAELEQLAGATEKAIDHYRAAAGLQADAVSCRRSLGKLLLDTGRAEEAVASYREVLTLEPQAARSHYELGNALAVTGRMDEAIERFRQAVRLEPGDCNAHVNLGYALNSCKRFAQARQCFVQALAIDPELVEAHNNLGGVLQMQGELGPAMRAYERALDLAPDQLYVRSNYLTCLNYHDEANPDEVFEQHRRWSAQFANAPAAAMPVPTRQADAERRLRIGYVSADFRFHSVAFFIAPILECHDRARFEITCYANVAQPDANTERLKSCSDHWRDIAGLSDAEVAAWIRRDAIDVLVDLSGHTVGNRLPVFATRPAPVQVTYLGYPNTTGLASMDYRLTDALTDPPGRSDRLHTEKLIRLEGGFLCFQPLQSCPEVRARASSADGITFASFNELLKLTPPTVRAWCEILARTPGSKLLIKGTTLEDAGTRELVTSRFVEHGLDPTRLELVGRTATLEEHLELYNEVDIGLDTFPYNGTTTTCEALWMGVPVVTRSGEVHASRVGLSLLSNVGLDDLVAENVEQYIDKAVALARDHDRRRQLRRSLRERMRSSELMDARATTRRIEAAYRDMWRRACQTPSHGPESQTGADLSIAIRGEVHVHVPARIGELTPYVLLEQEDWFEDEIHFVRRALGPGMRCLDIGANYGVFTLTCARLVGPEGHVWSFEPTPATASYLSTSIEENGFKNISLMRVALSRVAGRAKLVTHADSEHNYLGDKVGDDTSFEIVDVRTLDDVADEQDLTGIDFVKVDAEGAEIDILEGGRRFIQRESPMIMFEYKYREGSNQKLVDALQAHGFHIYRLIPGLRILAPFDREDVDAFQLNLFAVKPEHALALESQGLAVGAASAAASVGGVEPQDFIAVLARRAYARELLPRWRRAMSAAGGQITGLHMGLACYCRARDGSLTAGERFEALRQAYACLSEPLGTDTEVARLYSLARVAAELGRRQQAVEVLNAICARVDARTHTPGDAPFLAVSARFDDIEPGDAFAQWCLASVLEQRERLAAYSSYFQDERVLSVLEMLEQLPFQCAEMERRRQLMRMRCGRQTSPQPSAILARAADDNLNADFWSSAAAGQAAR